MRRPILTTLGLIVLAGAAFIGAEIHQRTADSSGPSSSAAFDRWLATGPGENRSTKIAHFAEFESFLDEHGVADVVPNWQLWRIDAHYAAVCGSEFFAGPPEQLWREIVPTLRLVRDEVIPLTGPVEVASGFRSAQINECVNGAGGSKHLSFAALDLIAVEMHEREDLFSDLCALQRRVGQERGMGLGAYFDPDDLGRGKKGRFHIDAAGYRTWGFDYTRKSNPCPRLG